MPKSFHPPGSNANAQHRIKAPDPRAAVPLRPPPAPRFPRQELSSRLQLQVSPHYAAPAPKRPPAVPQGNAPKRLPPHRSVPPPRRPPKPPLRLRESVSPHLRRGPPRKPPHPRAKPTAAFARDPHITSLQPRATARKPVELAHNQQSAAARNTAHNPSSRANNNVSMTAQLEGFLPPRAETTIGQSQPAGPPPGPPPFRAPPRVGGFKGQRPPPDDTPPSRPPPPLMARLRLPKATQHHRLGPHSMETRENKSASSHETGQSGTPQMRPVPPPSRPAVPPLFKPTRVSPRLLPAKISPHLRTSGARGSVSPPTQPLRSSGPLSVHAKPSNQRRGANAPPEIPLRPPKRPPGPKPRAAAPSIRPPRRPPGPKPGGPRPPARAQPPRPTARPPGLPPKPTNNLSRPPQPQSRLQHAAGGAGDLSRPPTRLVPPPPPPDALPAAEGRGLPPRPHGHGRGKPAPRRLAFKIPKRGGH